MATPNDDIEVLEEENLGSLDEQTDWKAKAEEIQTKHREAGIRNRERTKALKERLAALEAATKQTTPTETKTESSELDYSQKAFLLAKGIEEFDIVLEEAKKFGGDLKSVKLEELIDNPYFKQRIESVRTTKANELAASAGTNRSGVAGRNSVDYWLAKGEHPPKELGKKIAEEYVEAKRNQGKNAKQFYND